MRRQAANERSRGAMRRKKIQVCAREFSCGSGDLERIVHLTNPLKAKQQTAKLVVRRSHFARVEMVAPTDIGHT
jgi:hypothetical protein